MTALVLAPCDHDFWPLSKRPNQMESDGFFSWIHTERCIRCGRRRWGIYGRVVEHDVIGRHKVWRIFEIDYWRIEAGRT